jgi:hypothetical protein
MPHKNSTLGNGMNKADLLKGFLRISGSVFSCLRFHNLIYSYDFIIGIQIMKSNGSCVKLITLSAILDLLIFTISLKLNKDFIGGIIIAAISLIILTLFI